MRIRITVLLGLATAGMALVCSVAKAQSKPDEAAMREAIRFERNKAAASQRQARQGPSHPSQAGEADRSAPDSLESKDEPKTDAKALAEAIRYEKSKDAAAASQMRQDARQSRNTKQ